MGAGGCDVSRRLELLLCRIHRRKYCLLVGNATTGLYLALKAHGLTGKRIAIPNAVCPNVPLAIYLAGATPIYLDISRETFGLNLEELVRAPSVEGVIAVHAYGVACAIADLEGYCAKKGVFVIEDVAVAQGVTVNAQPAGSFGSVSIVSFGAGKIIDAGGGGAVLTDDKELYQALLGYDSQLPHYEDSFRHRISELGSYHTQLYNKVYLARQYDRLPSLFLRRALSVGPSFLQSFPVELEVDVYQKLKELPTLIRNRLDNAQYLYDALCEFEDIGIHAVTFPKGSVPWRFNLLIDRGRDELLRSLLDGQLRISSWYPSIDLFFERRSQSHVETPVSDDISSRILNIWVNESVNKSYLREISQRIIKMCSVF